MSRRKRQAHEGGELSRLVPVELDVRTPTRDEQKVGAVAEHLVRERDVAVPCELRLRAVHARILTACTSDYQQVMTAWLHARVRVRFRRAIERRALWLAEDAARELPNLPLEDALQVVHLYFERGSPKAEPAARRWLVRYLSEGTPSLRDVAKVTASLAERELEAGGMN